MVVTKEELLAAVPVLILGSELNLSLKLLEK